MTPFALPPRALLLDDARPGGRSRLFRDPVDWIEVHDSGSVETALARIDRAVAQGFWVAGAFAFELGYLLEEKLQPLFRESPDPLITVGFFEGPEFVDGRRTFDDLAAGRSCMIGPPVAALDFAAYEMSFARVRDYIASGDAYQINLTFPLTLKVEGDPFARLASWRTRAGAGHAAVLRLADRDILSFSPELFLQSGGDGLIRTRPMKGTLARGPDAMEDDAAKADLQSDAKQRAENLMIVDLLRNDLARVCETGSVRVSDLFTVETYPTLHTLTSGVEGRLRPGTQPSEILRALFPCGSVTGAPKMRAMEIIAETERSARGIYCGAVGAIGPGLSLDLNVAIRTLVHERASGALRMGVGGGLVYDSRAAAEYEEALLKSRFATAEAPEFDLLETMRWEQGVGIFFLDEHLQRLADTAAYFAVPYDDIAIRAALDAFLNPRTGMLRVRLRLGPDGTPCLESAPLEAPFLGAANPIASPLRLALAQRRLSSRDPFARHKTTRRAAYDAALAEANAAGADEAILLNEHGRVADGSFTTLFVLRGGKLLTPPPSEGALPGILKRILAARAVPPVVEASLSLDDLRSADALYAGNSVRGLLPARLI